MGLCSPPFCGLPMVALLLVCLSSGLIGNVTGADVSIDGYLGETITLHGVSYVDDNVYLFLTGPNLPADGVTLTDVSQRADQGHFTVVPVDNNQEWTYLWQTSRIEPSIDPGTYTVYVTNEPVDYSQLGSTSSYKTLSVFLKDSGASKVSVNAGHSYTLRPESHTSTIVPQISSPTPATLVTIPTSFESPPATTLPLTQPLPAASSTKSGIGPYTTLLALTGCGCGILLLRNREP